MSWQYDLNQFPAQPCVFTTHLDTHAEGKRKGGDDQQHGDQGK